MEIGAAARQKLVLAASAQRSTLVSRSFSQFMKTCPIAAFVGIWCVAFLAARMQIDAQVAIPDSAPPVAVAWISDSDGDWNDPAKWSTGQVPGAADAVLIDRAGANPTITHSSGNSTVKSLQCQEAFSITGGSLTVTGSCQFNGTFAMTNYASLTASGAQASVSVSGSATLQAANIFALGGGVIDASSVTSYEGGTYDNTQFDWASYWTANTCDKAVVVGPNPPADVRTYSYPNTYGTFNNVRRIGSLIQPEGVLVSGWIEFACDINCFAIVNFMTKPGPY